ERERDRGTVGRIELVFVENLESSGGNRRPVRNAILLQVVLCVADEPATDVRGGGARIVELNRVFQRQVRVAEHFIHHYIRQRQIVALARRSRGVEARNVARSIGKSALRNSELLRSKADRSHQRSGR